MLPCHEQAHKPGFSTKDTLMVVNFAFISGFYIKFHDVHEKNYIGRITETDKTACFKIIHSEALKSFSRKKVLLLQNLIATFIATF